MSEFRIERDLLGEREIPQNSLYGIHTLRAMENFALSGRMVHSSLIHAYGAVKLACARTNHELGWWDETISSAIEAACIEMMEGRLDEYIVVDALQGGAGTSTNMNVNEVLANRALQLLGKPPGEYETIHPIEDINLHQSTNDTYPTALRVAAIRELRALEKEIIGLMEEFQRKEKTFAHVVKIGRTELQDAVLTTLGREMSAYAEAFTRDRWRIYKCEERLRVVNLGGTAIGTGVSAPRQFIFKAVEHLRNITGFGLVRSENLVEATQNMDNFVEVSGILKACASNLLKVANDLRLLSSGPEGGFGEIQLPVRQAGSTIMPGKVNPVIPEAVGQAAITVMANDQIIAQAASMGNLELNQYMPLIADALLTNLHLLRRASRLFERHCVRGLVADEKRCRKHVDGSTATLPALIEAIGYETAEEIARISKEERKSIREIIIGRGLLTPEQFDLMVSPESVNRLGSVPKSENT